MPLASSTLPPRVRPAAMPRPRRARASRPNRRLMRLLVNRPGRDVVVVTVSGEVDALTAPRLAELVQHRLLARPALLVVDLSAVAFLGVAGLGVLLRFAAEATARGVELRIVTGQSPVVQRILDVTGAGRELPITSEPEVRLTECC
jgi:anti-sigma B factor antagonist